jgi:DNA polymerase-3 subunit delta
MPQNGLDFLRQAKNSDLLPLYYFYGEEGYLIDRAVEALDERTVDPALKSMNYHLYHASEAEPLEIVDACSSLPAFAPWRVVLVKDAHLFSATQLDCFINYVKQPSPTTLLIFTGEKADLRKSFFKEIEKGGAVVRFPFLKRNQLSFWMRREAEGRGKTITAGAVDCMIEMIGVSLRELTQEIEKVSLLTGERNAIELKDVEESGADIKVHSVFDFTDAIGSKDILKALTSLGRLLHWGEPSPKILSMVERHFRLLWRIKLMLQKGLDRGGIASRVGMSPYILNIYLEQEKRISGEELQEIFNELYSADRALKSSRMPDKMVLERVSLRLCGEHVGRSRNESSGNG